LQDNALVTRQTITNRSNEPMPFALGFHPYFAVSDKTQLEFDIPSHEFLDQRAGTTHSFTGDFDLERDELDLIFKELTTHSASVIDLHQGTKLILEFSDTFSNLVFWTVKGKDFYCLEPWTAGRNALNTGDRLIYLDIDASLDTFVNFRVTQL
jgi:galactose mutarotase-like enzyme